MTEKKGGSDVALGTETIARPCENGDGSYRLFGYKWFTSATDANIAITLARIENKKGETQEVLPFFIDIDIELYIITFAFNDVINNNNNNNNNNKQPRYTISNSAMVRK